MKNGTNRKKIRAFIINSLSGKSIGNMLVDAEAVYESGGCEKRVFLGTLASDHQGYVSFDLSPLQNEDQPPSRLLLYPTGKVAEAQDLSKRLTSDDRDPVAVLMAPPSAEPERIRSFPAIQAPDVIDWVTSPGSFGAAPPEVHLGEAECEEFVVSRVPSNRYRIRQIVRDADAGTPESLRATERFGSCESDLDPGEFAEGDPCVRRGAAVEYEVVWNPVGHGLGDILYTLPLAPCEAASLAVVDWSRVDRAERLERGATNDQMIHNLRRDRVIDETLDAAVSEWQRGESTMGGNAGAGSFTFGQGYGFSGNHSFGYGMSSTRGDRSITADSVQQLQDSIAQASQRTRQLYSTVIVQASETESDRVQTRTVRNHNRCHALTIVYFAVVRHYRVTARISRIRDVLLIRPPASERIPPPGKPFPSRLHEHILRNRLVLSRYLLDAGLLPGLDAMERLTVAVPPTVHPRLILKYVVSITTAGDNSDPSGRLIRLIVMTRDGVVRRFELGGNRVPTEAEIGEYSLFRDRQSNTFSVINELRLDGFLETLDDISQVGIHYSRADQDQWRMARLVVSAAVARFVPDGRGGGEFIDRELIKLAERNEEYFFEDDGDMWLPAVYPADPLAVERREILGGREDDEFQRRRLEVHLQRHSHYYNRLIWLSEDPNRRATEYEKYEFGLADGTWRRLIDVIENRALDVVGEYVAFPTRDATGFSEALAETIPEPVEQIVGMPSRGAFAEAKLGHCNGCEIIDDTRLWDARPCGDSAPEITGVTPGSRAAAGRDYAFAPKLSLTDAFGFADVPGAPDPNGLANVLTVLGKSDIFRDQSTQGALKDLLIKLAEGAVEVEKARLAGASAPQGGASGGSGGGGSGGGGSGGAGSGDGGDAGASPGSGSDARAVEAAMSSIERILRRGQRDGSLSESEAQDRLRDARITAIERLLSALRPTEQEEPEPGSDEEEGGDG